MRKLAALTWPRKGLGEVLAGLARQSGMTPRPVEAPIPPSTIPKDGDDELGRWLEAAADWLHLETDPAQVLYSELDDFVRSAGPAILRLPDQEQPRFLALLGGSRKKLRILGPDLDTHLVPTETVVRALADPLERPLIPGIDSLLEEAGVPAHLRGRSRQGILRERLGPSLIPGCWLLRPSMSFSFLRLFQFARLPRRAFVLIGAYALQYLVWILSWWVIGSAYFTGGLSIGVFLAWGLLLLTLVPLRMLVTWTQGTFAIGAGGLLKQRLLWGALKLETEETRHQGAGQFLGRAMESEAMESLALSGGILALMASIELVGAFIVLAAGAAGVPHALLLVAWVVLW